MYNTPNRDWWLSGRIAAKSTGMMANTEDRMAR
jgi:hypothetical protein